VAFKARCQVVRGDQRCGEASSFRGIGTHLLHRFGDTQQSVVITSLSPQSGKTTCACNLALVLARSARKVVLVDIHPQGAALGRVFRDKGDRPDLSMVLADPSELDKALQETDTTNLKVLHCRSSDGWVHRTNMASLADLTRKLAQRFDWVIYDAGPLQAQLTGNLLHVVGKVLYIKAISDPQSSEEVVEQIERCGALSIGTVENTPLKTTTPVHQG